MTMNQKKSKLFFFGGMALFLGRSTDTNKHKHHALQIGLGLSGEFKLKSDDLWTRSRAVIIKANHPHIMTGVEDDQAILLLDSETDIARQIHDKYLHDRSFHALESPLFFPVYDKLASLLYTAQSCQTAKTAMEAILDTLLTERLPSEPKDPRILKVIDFLSGLDEKKISLMDISNFICLSESRLTHLFKAQTGIPIRRYLLWLRLMEAICLIFNKASFTRAAHETGFADSAHLSRTFKQMFGMAPNKILKNSRFIQAFSCGS
ncbi:MAG: helix-turn-helix transcriptional regulator [Desulfobacteraceae bacterium]|nr:helix-turn-helix transcriptional regulator [Desulfobacteraceae bacterium]